MIFSLNELFRRLFNNSVAKNFSIVTLSTALSQLFGIFATIKIARILNVSDYGLFSFLLVQGQLIITIGDLGIKNIVIRSIARDKSRTKDLIYNGIKLRAMGVLGLIIVYLAFNHFTGSLSSWQLILLSLFALTTCFSNLFEAAYWGHEKMFAPAILSVSFSLIWLCFILFATSLDANYLFLIYILISTIKGIFSYIILFFSRILEGRVDKFTNSAKSLLREGWPYLVLTLIMIPSNYLTNNFLDINSSKEQIGYFNLSNKLMGPISMVLGIALSALFPNLSSLWGKNEEKFRIFVGKGFKYFVLIALIITFSFSFLIKEIVILLFTEKYLNAVKVCQLQIWYVFLMGINSFIGTVLGAMNKERLILVTGIVNAGLAIPILFYSSYYGALGLSYGYLVAFGIFEIILWVIFKRKTNISIKGDLFFWMGATVLFLLTYFFIDVIIFPVRLVISFIMISIFGYVILFNKKRLKIVNES